MEEENSSPTSGCVSHQGRVGVIDVKVFSLSFRNFRNVCERQQIVGVLRVH